jgi:hypothetical protein
MILFEDLKGLYYLFDFDASHGELLLRNHKYNEKLFNTDLRFKGVNQLNLTNRFYGIRISAIEPKIGVFVKNEIIEKFIFEVEDIRSGTKCYINSSAFGVYKNYFESKKSSLGDYSKENECLYWTSDDSILKKKYS